MATPIEIWPIRKYSGRPGYSAKHFAALDNGGPDTPLLAAERILARTTGRRIAAQATARRAAGEADEDVCNWMTATIEAENRRNWHELCASFDAVINALESETPTPAIKRLIRDARRYSAGG